MAGNGQTLAATHTSTHTHTYTMSASHQDHQLLHSSNRAKEVSELHTQMASNACVNSMSIRENLRSTHCVYKAIIMYFVGEQNEQQILFVAFRTQTERNFTQRNTAHMNKGKHLHAHVQLVWNTMMMMMGFWTINNRSMLLF